jgi:hypothetical protein
MSNKLFAGLLTGFFLVGMSSMASATAVSITNGSGANGYVIGYSDALPYTLTGNHNNDGVLYLWDEVQNFTLTENLLVDRVADASASYVGGTLGNYYIAEGTIVSSHYVQWDPLSTTSVQATLNFDSDIFAFITADNNLFASDYLGHPSIDYGNFTLRGLESGDTTAFNSGSVDISWAASSPGDWTRLITAYSSSADPVPEPATMFLFATGLLGLAGFRFRKQKR